MNPIYISTIINKIKDPTKKFLIKEYVVNKNSMSTIARKLNCAVWTIKNRLKLYNIKITKVWCWKNAPAFIDGRKVISHFCIENCGTKISYKSWKYGNKRCQKCAHKILHKNRCSCFICKAKRGETKGKNSAMFGRLVRHMSLIKYKNIYMRSSWEVKYAKYLQKNHIQWRYEPKTFPLTYEIGFGKIKETTYTPDFYLSKTKEYIEIKGWWRDDAEEKFANFQQQYPNIKITVLMKPELQKLGILK